jgi:predicted metal-dependent phosphoesterase TrpH
VIDLHLHTTASDGRSTPVELVREAVAAGITKLAVTDHDTVAAVPHVVAAAEAAGVLAVAGIEITAVHDGRDVHVLGYFVDPLNIILNEFLVRQRQDRRRRVIEIADRLEALGAPVDRVALTAAATQPGKSPGRPLVAAALIAAGHVRDIPEAFDRYLSPGAPAFIERIGAPPADVVRLIDEAGGLAAIAHPGKMQLDEIIPTMVEAGMPAIEVFHPDHGASDIARYQEFAARFGLLMTGGSDYHGPGTGRAASLGRLGISEEAFAALADRARAKRP